MDDSLNGFNLLIQYNENDTSDLSYCYKGLIQFLTAFYCAVGRYMLEGNYMYHIILYIIYIRSKPRVPMSINNRQFPVTQHTIQRFVQCVIKMEC